MTRKTKTRKTAKGTITIKAIEFPNAHEAIQFAEASGEGEAIFVDGRYLVARQWDIDKIVLGHGGLAVLSRRSALVHGNRETSTNLRFKFGNNLVCDPKHAVHVKDPSRYRLPADHTSKQYIFAKEDFFFVYPTRFHEYENKYRGSFQHGGISLEEMILPVATLTPRG